jgi:hypothetical protein
MFWAAFLYIFKFACTAIICFWVGNLDLGEGPKVVKLLLLNQENEIRHRYLTSFLVAKQAVLPVEPWIDPLKTICKILNSIGIWSRSKCGVVYLLWCHVLDLLSSEKFELA